MIRLFVARDGGRPPPGDLVGAITGEAGIQSRSIGAIEINDGFSLVEVPEAWPTTSSTRCGRPRFAA